MFVKTTENIVFESSETESILDSALNRNLVFEYSCKTGQCGVCKTTLLEGEVAEVQEQLALTDIDKADHKILTCCCAPKTDILIDAEDLSVLHGVEIKTYPARISTIVRLTDNIVEVDLRLPPTAEFKFIEGQYLDVIWGSIRRSYSICSIASRKQIKLLIKRFENGQMSEYWFDQANANDLIRIEGPKGTFFLRDNSVPLIFLATGTGIAPVISMLDRMDEDENFNQSASITVYWGNRYPDEFVWQPSFKKLNVNFVRVCSCPDQGWAEEEGYVQDIALQKQNNLEGFSVYACGSNAMIQSARKLFVEFGLSENQFYSDAFVQSY